MAEQTDLMKKSHTCALLLCILLLGAGGKRQSLDALITDFCSGYKQLNIPGITYDYKEYFNAIPPLENLQRQEEFFSSMRSRMLPFKAKKLKHGKQVQLDHLEYEIEFNMRRIALEKNWVTGQRMLHVNGLHGLQDYKAWYTLFIQKFTSLDIRPEEVMSLGINELERVKNEMRSLQEQAGFKDSVAFYRFLNSDTFVIYDKQELLNLFHTNDSIIRTWLPEFAGRFRIPRVFPMEWPGAGAHTPPGMYLSKTDNAYGRAVFQYNFYGNRFNRRSIDWIYMHEALPGHHLQWCFRNMKRPDPLQELGFYPGNFEGWACYVEYYGKELGMYRDLYSYFGKWEWDLVRSARLVIETGIHYYGWTREEALAYWKKHIPGQDDIAEREITRVTNWPGQALTYKTGAKALAELRKKMEQKEGTSFDRKRFHRCFLSFGSRPMSVIIKHFENAYHHEK